MSDEVEITDPEVNNEAFTSVSLKERTRARLKTFKKTKSENYDAVLNRLMDNQKEII